MKYNDNSDKIIDLIKHAMINTRTQQKDIVVKIGLNKGTIINTYALFYSICIPVL